MKCKFTVYSSHFFLDKRCHLCHLFDTGIQFLHPFINGLRNLIQHLLLHPVLCRIPQPDLLNAGLVCLELLLHCREFLLINLNVSPFLFDEGTELLLVVKVDAPVILHPFNEVVISSRLHLQIPQHVG